MTKPIPKQHHFAPLLLPQLRKTLDRDADPIKVPIALTLAGMADAHRERTPQAAAQCLRDLLSVLDDIEAEAAPASYLTAMDLDQVMADLEEEEEDDDDQGAA